MKEYKAKYDADNQEKIKEYKAKYRANNQEKIKAYASKYHANNPEKKKAYASKYHANNPEKKKAKDAKLRIRLSDGYLSDLMKIPVATATPELLQLKRDQIILIRSIREFKNAIK